MAFNSYLPEEDPQRLSVLWVNLQEIISLKGPYAAERLSEFISPLIKNKASSINNDATDADVQRRNSLDASQFCPPRGVEVSFNDNTGELTRVLLDDRLQKVDLSFLVAHGSDGEKEGSPELK